MSRNLAFVLRTGRAYGADYLDFLAGALREHKVQAKVYCLTDLPDVPKDWTLVPLKHGWPGWWSKLELMRPDFLPGETVHFIDADTFIRGNLEPFLEFEGLAMLTDFYRRDRFGSGVMVLPPAARERAWNAWKGNPEFLMRRHHQFGDQGFLQDQAWKGMGITHLQKVLPPDFIASFKRTNKVHLATQLLCCHGSPKPRELGWTPGERPFPWGEVDERAETVAIVADGPSATELRGVQFPKDVYVLAVNGAVEWLRDPPSGFFTLDPSAPNRRRLRDKRKGTRYYAAVSDDFGQANSRVLGHRAGLEPDVTWLRRMEGKEDRALRSRHGLSPDPRGVHTGNSCYGALGLAKHLGAKRIVLFGLDASQQQRVSGGMPGGLSHLPRLFASAAPDLEGVEVVNASPASNVKCWPRVTVREGLKLLGVELLDESARETDKYTRMWALDSYRERSPGLRVLPSAIEQLKPDAGATFYDFGCGHGYVVEELVKQGFKVMGLDIAPNAKKVDAGEFAVACLWDIPAELEPRDYGFCVDVLEHLPTKHVVAALRSMGQRIRKRGYFQAALFHDHCGDAIGETLHLTVKPVTWWRTVFQQVFGPGAKVTPDRTGKYAQAVVDGLAKG